MHAKGSGGAGRVEGLVCPAVGIGKVVLRSVSVDGTGLVRGEEEVRWKELHRQEWKDSVGRIKADGKAARITRATPGVVVVARYCMVVRPHTAT